MAGLARGSSEAVPAAVRSALDVSGYAAAGVGCGAVRAARSSSPTPPIASWCWSNWPRSGSRPTSCWSRCGAIPGRRSRPARPLRRRATSDAIVLALAADHVVRDTRRLRRRLPRGTGRRRSRAHRDLRRAARARRPPNTAISVPGEAISGEVRAVAKFVEKPDPATAADYVKAGYLWNSGNFMFRAAVLLG